MSFLVCCLLFATIGESSDSPSVDPAMTFYAPQDERAVEDNKVLAVEHRRKSTLFWLYDALGFRYAVLLPICGCIALWSSVRMVVISPRRKPSAFDWFVLSLPVLIGLAGSMSDFVYLWNLHSRVRPMQGTFAIWEVSVSALESTLVGFVTTLPAYFVAGIGLPLRRLFARTSQNSN